MTRRYLISREPIAGCDCDAVAKRLAALGTVQGVKIDDLADACHIVLDCPDNVSEYAICGIAPRPWRINAVAPVDASEVI